MLETEAPSGGGRLRCSASRVFKEDPFSSLTGPAQLLNVHYAMASITTELSAMPDSATEMFVRGKVRPAAAPLLFLLVSDCAYVCVCLCACMRVCVCMRACVCIMFLLF